MDHPPREMKERLFTRHNQTVVPLLANTKKASLQAVHTSFVNTAIDNMTDNRVLNYRPPPISDKETYLMRRQQATLSQLCSGHCKLLNSYKKRLKQGCTFPQKDTSPEAFLLVLKLNEEEQYWKFEVFIYSIWKVLSKQSFTHFQHLNCHIIFKNSIVSI